MLYLIEAAQELGLQAIVDQARESKNVHGIMIDIHPLWLEAWKLHIRNPNALYFDYFDYRRFQYNRLSDYLYDMDIAEYDGPMFPATSNINIHWFPDNWRNIFKKSNLIVKVLLQPGTEVIKLNYQGQLLVTQEHRPIPQFATSPTSAINPLVGGVSIGHAASIAGTLGGILTDNRKSYGLTCAHVLNTTGLTVDQPAQKDSKRKATAIGDTVFVDHPTINSTSDLCTDYAPGTKFNDMDLALIELYGGTAADKEVLKIGSIDGLMSCAQLHRNLAVEYTGRSSGHKSLVLGGIGVTNTIQIGSNNYCFQHLVELKEPFLSRLLLKRPVRQGDSGAWVTAQGTSGTEWCGMIIGEDRQTGYALMSEKIMTTLNNNGYALACS